MRCLLTCLFLVTILPLQAQKITYSEYNKKEGRDTYFDIIGRFDSSVLVYKQVARKHYITRYDPEMRISENLLLDFVGEKAFRLDFISYPQQYYLFYQTQKNNTVYFYAVVMHPYKGRVGEPMLLDTTKIGFFADNGIYSVTSSENKEKIMLYKRQVKNEYLRVVTRIFNSQLQLTDSSQHVMKYDDRRDFFSEMVVDNSGSFLFARGTGKSPRERANTIYLLLRRPGGDSLRTYPVSLNDRFVNEVSIKADNLNRHYLVNACYQGRKSRVVEGLFTAIVDMNAERSIQAVFNPFSDSMRQALNPTDKKNLSFDNLNIRHIVLKRKGGFFLAAEDYYSESMYNNTWNRNYWFYNNYYSGTANDFFINNPYYYYGYRPWNPGQRDANVRYYYNDILILSMDSSLRLEWNNVIHKKQYDVDTENFMSFSTLNTGKEVRFLYIDRDNQRQIVSSPAVLPDGRIRRYPTIRSNETGYGFMPRLARQIGPRTVIMPYIYLGYIAFARIDFNLEQVIE